MLFWYDETEPLSIIVIENQMDNPNVQPKKGGAVWKIVTAVLAVIAVAAAVWYLWFRPTLAIWTTPSSQLTASTIQNDLVGTWCSSSPTTSFSSRYKYTFASDSKCTLRLINDTTTGKDGSCRVTSPAAGQWQISFQSEFAGEPVEQWPLVINQSQHNLTLSGTTVKPNCPQ